jgi:glycosyltransferase involved in cell wall biosynthesis
MIPRIADALILVLPPGVSLRKLDDYGILEPEWALHERLLEHFGRLIIVGDGKADDIAILSDMINRLSPQHAGRADVVCNTSALSPTEWDAAKLARVSELCIGLHSAIVKTHQFEAAEAGVTITRHLRERNMRVALVARGGYPWSRFLAWEFGNDSVQARQAARSEARLCRRADIVVGTSAQMVEDLCWRYGVDAARGVVVPTHVSPNPDINAAAQRDESTILFVGPLIHRKRLDILIRAMAMLEEPDRTKARLCILGDGPMRGTLASLARDLNINAVFEPHPGHAKLLDCLSTCTISVHTSELEGLPRVVLEAMASGAPVIVADTPGLSRAVEHGATGLRVDPTPEAFAHAIGALLQDVEWRDLMGSRAAGTVREKYGLLSILPRELDAYTKALQYQPINNTRHAA